MSREPITWGPLRLEDFVRYAGASGDFNPLHYDRDHAQGAGMPDVIAQGMFSMGLLASSLETWFGTGRVSELSVRFRAPAFVGDSLVARVEEAGDGRVSVTLMRDETEIVSGRAVIGAKRDG